MKIGYCTNNPDEFNYKKYRDDYNYRYYILREKFKSKNIILEAFKECSDTSKYDVILEKGIQDLIHHKKYSLITESPLVRPQDWNLDKHKNYEKIFCWDDEMAKNIKYIKTSYAFKIPKSIPKKFNGKKLCCTISGNKQVNQLNELYSKRLEFIKWFENHHPNEFDLYGVGWDKKNFGKSLLGKILNKSETLRKLCFSKFTSYKGVVVSKNETMQKYKFSICYENIKDQSGYITEKIFDSFFAGCVPIYWGAKNVTDYIPKNCFIDKREFENYEKIYEYMASMEKKTYMNYLENIENYLNSNKADPFRAETFADTIVDEITRGFR